MAIKIGGKFKKRCLKSSGIGRRLLKSVNKGIDVLNKGMKIS